MTAVQQQCAPAEPTEHTATRTPSFIESMEEEMRRCAEHLERRQSRRRSHRSSWESPRIANGFAEVEGENGASRKRRGNTLPRSFTLSTDDVHDSWQHRNYRHPANQPSPTAGRERGGRYTRTMSYEKEAYGSRDERERTPTSGYSRGSSAPPESYTMNVSRNSYSGSSRSSSSVSPINRGVLTNHSRSSSRSSRSSASPPPVAPKPTRSKAYSKRNTGSRRLWSDGGADLKDTSAKVENTGPVFPSAEISQSDMDVFLEPAASEAQVPPATHHQAAAGETVLEANQQDSPAQPNHNQELCTVEPTVDSPSHQRHTETTILEEEAGEVETANQELPEEISEQSSSRVEQRIPEEQVEPVEPSQEECTQPLEATPEDTIPETPAEAEAVGEPSDDTPHEDQPLTEHPATVDGEEQKKEKTPELEDIMEEKQAMAAPEDQEVEETKESDEKETANEPPPLAEQDNHPSSSSLEIKPQASSGSADEPEDKAIPVDEAPEVSSVTANRAPSNASGKTASAGSQREEEHSSSTESDSNTSPRKPQSGVLSGSEITAPEVKSIPMKSVKPNRGHKQHHDNKPGDGSRRERGKSEPPTLSESKIQITVSSSVLTAQPAAMDSVSVLQRQTREELALLVKELQIRLKEKEDDLGRLKRQHERETREKDDHIKKLAKENKKVEREKWELLKRARDAAERSLHLRTQLDMKEAAFRTSQSENGRIRDELMSVKSANTSLRALLGDLRAPKSCVDQAIQVELQAPLRRNRSIELAFTQGDLSQEMDANLERASEMRMSTTSLQWPPGHWEGDGDTTSLGAGDSRDTTPIPGALRLSSHSLSAPEGKKTKKRRIFGRMLHRSSGSKRGSVTSMDGLDLRQSSLISGPIRGSTPLGYPYQPVPSDLKEHWRVLDEFKNVPFSQWTLQAIVSWMEAGIGMSQYTAAVKEKVSSGNSLLGFSESDLEKKLGIHNPLHRRKLKLAIQDQRSPQSCQYPHAGRIDHSWVSNEWLLDVGLPHLSEVLNSNLVDGRVLNSLTKDDIRRYLKVSKKTDQISFLSGVELLRMHDFNREAILQHRRGSKNPFYWTNRDVCDWLKENKLEDYANNVIGGGVHGALLFLERGRFTAEHLATILKIPMSKSQVRRHLAEKLEALFSEDITDSLDPPPRMSGSPLHLSPGGSQSPGPDRRFSSPHHIPSSPLAGPANDIHPTRRNSLRSRTPSLTRFSTLTQPDPSLSPPPFTRTGSQPSILMNSVSPVHNRGGNLSPGELARRSLRESALRSVTSSPGREQSLQLRRTLTPTVLSSASCSTTV